MEIEVWKPVKGYENLYEISTLGWVKRLSRIKVDTMGRKTLLAEKILINRMSRQTGYPCVNLSKNGKVKTHNIHKLIADAFIPNPDKLPCINHIDENRGNSILTNLERCDYSYNNKYGNAVVKRKKTYRKNLEGKHKIIYQFTKDGELLEIFDCGVKQVEEKLGYYIGDCLLGKSKTAHGFIFSYSCDFSYNEDIPKRHQKYVFQIDENGHIIEKYKSVSDASKKNGFDRHFFSKKKSNNGIITIKGKRFIVEQKENEYIPKGHKGSRPDLLGKGVKAVCQYTKKGEFVKKYASIKDAAESLGIPKAAPEISNCCNGKLKTARGFVWAHDREKPKMFKNDAKRCIVQYTLLMEFVHEYNSISDAIKALGYGVPTCIGNNLAGRSKSAYGYIWRYKKE